MDIDVAQWAVLLVGAAGAGWVDAVIGGGGLVLIPLLLAVIPGLAPATALATNKLAAVSGTASAAVTLVRRVRPPAGELVRYALIALVCAGLGASVAANLNSDIMRPLIIVLLVVVGAFVTLKPSFGTTESLGIRGGWRTWAGLVAVAAISFYDGIFGPGTGMFLIMAFTFIFSQNFVKSAAMAKVVNTATNLGALVTFIFGGHVWWTLGIALAAANILGAQVGARMVLSGGTKFIRYALLTLVVVMSCYLSWQQWG
ncbi:TSUP family transporter [Corynebacterium macginleyi]|uniref:TSUP family transporter n=1 Tax=Corynebacterium macginleyi TaxID=38290 RepID=UPI0019090E83|nr:TSUP family transporter [Corynebacterium macginleyi]MBK4142274.1 TSUP family transporter [Corynebacterium macginleyi]MBK4164248.1 TSUP family transporter [Corynebacterium macginleyi]